MLPEWIKGEERRIINKLVTSILNKGFYISVFDGEEWTVKKEQDFRKITDAIAATDETILRIRTYVGFGIGTFWLIHGNGEDVIADHSDNDLCNQLFEEATE